MLTVTKIPVGPFVMNCYIIFNIENNNTVVIDPGDEIEKIKNYIEDNNLKVQAVLNTHGHIDHAGKVAKFLGYFKVDYLIHKEDIFWLDRLEEQSRVFGLEFVGKPQPTKFLNDGDILDYFLGETIKVIHTPGHTPGSTSFLIGKELFTGDTLFKGTIGRTDFPKSDYGQLISSIKQKLFKLPPETIVHPGHQEDTTIKREMTTNPFLI
ncbi:MAG: MBL fold metallo-hydrolase [Planctomycetota bacterium]